MSEWNEQVNTPEGRAIINGRLPDGTPIYQAASQPPPVPEKKKPSLVCFDGVEYEDARFLISPYIPSGKITIIQGDSGTGKTAFSCKLAAVVSTGGGILDHRCGKGRVLMLSVEDDPSTLRGRIEASGGDLRQCFFLDDASELTFLSPEIEEAVRDSGIKLVIFDPLQAFLGAKVDMHRANETRPILAQLSEMAKRNDCAVVIISHLNKSTLGTKAIYRALGSVDIVAASRSVLYVGCNPEDEEQRIVCHIKSSNAKAGRSFAYRIGDRGGVTWDGYSSMTADDLQRMADRKETGQTFEDDPAVITVTRLLEENPQGVFVSYDALTNYASRIFGFPPCADGKAWKTRLTGLQRELIQQSKICIEFAKKYTNEHVELGEQIPATKNQERGVMIRRHTPKDDYQIFFKTMNHS